jgi:hypothetical protein
MMVIITLKIGLSKNVQQNLVANTSPKGDVLARVNRYIQKFEILSEKMR